MQHPLQRKLRTAPVVASGGSMVCDFAELLLLRQCIGTASKAHLKPLAPPRRALQQLQPRLVVQPTRARSMLAAMQHCFAGLCVAERRVVVGARATQATRRSAHDHKVVKLALMPPIRAVRARVWCAS